MTNFSFVVRVAGEGAVELPVTVDGDVSLSTGRVDVDFSVRNILDRRVEFSEITIGTEGPSASKITASLQFTTMTIEPQASGQNRITIEANEELVEGDEAGVRVEAEEA